MSHVTVRTYLRELGLYTPRGPGGRLTNSKE